MPRPRVDKLLDKTGSHYATVIIAAKRARQINAYYYSLAEGTYGEYTPPMVESKGSSSVSVALDELAQDKLKFEYKD